MPEVPLTYLTCISVKPTKLHRDAVIGWFANEAGFRHWHNQKIEFNQIENWLEILIKTPKVIKSKNPEGFYNLRGFNVFSYFLETFIIAITFIK